MKLNKKEITKICKREEFIYYFSGSPNNIGFSALSMELDREGLINFTLEFRETENDSWIQAEYYCEKISKAIIIDYDFTDYFDDIDKFLKDLQYIEDEIERINKLIK